jgi:hypothetical protein
MRLLPALLLVPAIALGQANSASGETPATPVKVEIKNQLIIPSGTKVPVVLQHAISSKNAREGDPIYAHTSFPVVADDHILIPAGTYVQGKIVQVQRAGRVKGRAEMLMHFTTLIFPNGYTVMLPGAVDNVPGSENTNMKGAEGSVQQSSQKGKDAEKIATASGKGAEGGALIGALASRSAGGTLAGAGAGAVLGAAIALFGRGNDVRLESGTTVEMVIQREVPLDAARVQSSGQWVQQVSR